MIDDRIASKSREANDRTLLNPPMFVQYCDEQRNWVPAIVQGAAPDGCLRLWVYGTMSIYRRDALEGDGPGFWRDGRVMP